MPRDRLGGIVCRGLAWLVIIARTNDIAKGYVSLLHRLVMQYRVWLDVVAIKQVVQLLASEGHGAIAEFWPVEAMLLQSLVVQAKTIVFPEQDLDAIVTAIGEHIEFF